jgi:hypothetical protein
MLRRVAEDNILHSHRRENLTSYIIKNPQLRYLPALNKAMLK